MKIPVKELARESFDPYGRILLPRKGEQAEVQENGLFDFYVPFIEQSQGWQIGYLLNKTKHVAKLERHPNTPEVFCPLSGESVLVVSENPMHPESVFGFTLTRPIVCNRGVWHGVLTASGLSEILIVENPDVIDEFFELNDTITL